jgi:enoyl-CoA hydratase/carnithine racemase
MIDGMSESNASPAELLHDVHDGIATVTLNRPATLNALSMQMLVDLGTLLRNWADDPGIHTVVLEGAGEKAFCAGGDIRALRQSFVTGDRLHHDYFAIEYRLDYLLHRYPKFVIALMDGITMGGGMGISQGAQLRVVTERTKIAMPEVGIGLIPDVGASYFLSRLPGALGIYLALTGNQIKAADALYVGLADIYVPSELLATLAHTEHALRAHGQTQLPDPPLAAFRAAIDQHFSHATIDEILSSLRSETRPEYVEWAQQTLKIISTRSPLTVVVALRQLQRGKLLELADCFRMELGLVHNCFEQGDFIEGVRALIVDKDNAPRWRHRSIDAVTAAEVDEFFRDPFAGRVHPLGESGVEI